MSETQTNELPGQIEITDFIDYIHELTPIISNPGKKVDIGTASELWTIFSEEIDGNNILCVSNQEETIGCIINLSTGEIIEDDSSFEQTISGSELTEITESLIRIRDAEQRQTDEDNLLVDSLSPDELNEFDGTKGIIPSEETVLILKEESDKLVATKHPGADYQGCEFEEDSD